MVTTSTPALSFQALRTPLNSIRLLGVLSALSAASAFISPHTRDFFVGVTASISSILAVQLFQIKSIQAKPDPRDAEHTAFSISPR